MTQFLPSKKLHASGLLVNKDRVDIETAYPVISNPLIQTIQTKSVAKKWRKKLSKPDEKPKPRENEYSSRLSTFVNNLANRNSSAPQRRRRFTTEPGLSQSFKYSVKIKLKLKKLKMLNSSGVIEQQTWRQALSLIMANWCRGVMNYPRNLCRPCKIFCFEISTVKNTSFPISKKKLLSC